MRDLYSTTVRQFVADGEAKGMDAATIARRKALLLALQPSAEIQAATDNLAKEALDEVMADEAFWTDGANMKAASEPMREQQFSKSGPNPFSAEDPAQVIMKAQQRQIAEKIMKAYCGKLGLPIIPIVQEDVGNNQQNASFDKDKYQMFLFWNSLMLNPVGIVEAVTHELTHYYQRYLADQFQDGKLDEGDENFEMGFTFSLNFLTGMYIKHEEGDKDAYEGQPVEAHAFATGRAAQQHYNKQRQIRARAKKS